MNYIQVEGDWPAWRSKDSEVVVVRVIGRRKKFAVAVVVAIWLVQ